MGVDIGGTKVAAAIIDEQGYITQSCPSAQRHLLPVRPC